MWQFFRQLEKSRMSEIDIFWFSEYSTMRPLGPFWPSIPMSSQIFAFQGDFANKFLSLNFYKEKKKAMLHRKLKHTHSSSFHRTKAWLTNSFRLKGLLSVLINVNIKFWQSLISHWLKQQNKVKRTKTWSRALTSRFITRWSTVWRSSSTFLAFFSKTCWTRSWKKWQRSYRHGHIC